MTIHESLRQGLINAAFVGIGLCLAACLVLALHDHIRQLQNKFRPRLGHFLIVHVLAVGALIGYGGSKHTNGTNRASAPRQMRRTISAPRDYGITSPTHIANWEARGAYNDWAHLEFPEGFTFPLGLERISRATLMANGELRTNLANAAPLALLPQPVSIQPGVTTVTYGLRDSNTCIYAWHDALVDRSATNRTDAAIELFPDGSIAVSMNNPLIPNPYTLIPPATPEGFVGHGQDEDWVRGNFAAFQAIDPALTNVEQILSVGYTNWLTNWVGTDEPNGRYQAAVTVPDIGETPCYLVSGPFKVVLTQAGTYRFPFMVFTLNETRTYPDALPHTIAYDDGYTIDGTYEFEPYNAPSPRAVRALSATPASNITKGTVKAKLVLNPSFVPLNQARGKYLELRCNVPNAVWHYRALSRDFRLTFFGATSAQIDEAIIEDMVEIWYNYETYTIHSFLSIEEYNANYPSNRIDVVTAEGDTLHSTSNNYGAITYFTVGSQSGSTNEVRESTTVNVPAGCSCYVGAFMATGEQPDARIPHNDDIIGWDVSTPGLPTFHGETSVYQEPVGENYGDDYSQYGIKGWEHLIAARRFDAPSESALTLTLEAWAQNIGDDICQTCIQLVVYPIGPNDEIIGWPSWAPQPE